MKHEGKAFTSVVHVEMASFAASKGEYVSRAGVADYARLLETKIAPLAFTKCN
jgi:hypothetical protein